ncbi:MAG: hypothetical protein ACK53L_10700, partial [Pirellulaceae bacterium]
KDDVDDKYSVDGKEKTGEDYAGDEDGVDDEGSVDSEDKVTMEARSRRWQSHDENKTGVQDKLDDQDQIVVAGIPLFIGCCRATRVLQKA